MIGAIALAWPGPLQHEFLRNAVLAATPAALAVGFAGYFVVLRDQVFAADALSHVAFTAGMAALAVGVDVRVGVYGGALVLGALLGLLVGRAAHAGDAAIGVVFAWVLGLGAFFLSVFVSRQAATNSSGAVRVLFGSIFAVSPAQVRLTAVVSALVLAVVVVLGRPLLLATLQPEVASARGIPVRVIEVAFAAALGLAVAQAVQLVGALLLLGLVATPAAAAQQCTAPPWRAFSLSGVLAVGSLWCGITVSYLSGNLPPSFVVVTLLFAFYVAVVAGRRSRARTARSRPESARPAPAVSGNADSVR